jgi:hypothetical protein
MTYTKSIHELDKLKLRIENCGIETVIKITLKEYNILIDTTLDIKNSYILYIKLYTKKIDKKLLIQDLKDGLPNFDNFNSLDFLN